MSEATIQLRDKGVITLPMSLRRKYSMRTGDVFAVSDLGEGIFMITPKTHASPPWAMRWRASCRLRGSPSRRCWKAWTKNASATTATTMSTTGPRRPQLFFDASALFAGVISAVGAARALLLLSEAGTLAITVSEQVIAETERTLARKAPAAIPFYRETLRASRIRIVKDPSAAEVAAARDMIAHEPMCRSWLRPSGSRPVTWSPSTDTTSSKTPR